MDFTYNMNDQGEQPAPIVPSDNTRGSGATGPDADGSETTDPDRVGPGDKAKQT